MRVSNAAALVLLAAGVGAATTLSLIGSQAYLLSKTEAIYALYLATAGGFLFAIFLKKARIRLRFSAFSTSSALAFGALLLLLAQPFLSDSLRLGLWFGASIFASGFFKWIGTELVQRYLDPARAQSYLSYQVTAEELGILASVIATKTILADFGPLEMAELSGVLFVVIAAFIGLQFMSVSNREFQFTKKRLHPPEIDSQVLKPFLLYLILLTSCMGLFRISEEYLLRVVLKAELGSFDAIKEVVASYLLVASLLTMPLSLAVGYLTKRKRLSPIFLCAISMLLLLGATLFSLAAPTLKAFVALEVIRSVASNCFYVPANRMIQAAFVGDLRNRIRSSFYFYYFTILGLPMALIFSFSQRLGIGRERTFILILLALSLGLGLLFLFKVRGSLIRVMYAFLQSGHKTAAIFAAQSLSFLRPREFSRRMREILAASPKKLLRKTIVLGLGYSRDPEAVEAVIDEFSSDKEEIQMAALDALRVSRSYKGAQFMVNVAMARHRSKSMRIRMSAVFIMVGMFGRKAIPFFLNELENPEPRIVANILEALSFYRDKSLLPYFLKFKESPEPRVRVNALMGLSAFASTRKEYRRGIKEALRGGPVMAASAMYVIGKLRDYQFKEELERIYGSPLGKDPRSKPSLAWALARLGDRRGFALIGEILGGPGQEGERFLHFFSQLSRERRFDAIRYLAEHGPTPDLLRRVGSTLRHSVFDFHEEIEYLHLVALQVGKENGIWRLAPTPQK